MAWFMLVKGKGPENVFVVEETLGVWFAMGTFGTVVSVGHTTFGDRNCTFSLKGGGSGGAASAAETLPDPLLVEGCDGASSEKETNHYNVSL